MHEIEIKHRQSRSTEAWSSLELQHRRRPLSLSFFCLSDCQCPCCMRSSSNFFISFQLMPVFRLVLWSFFIIAAAFGADESKITKIFLILSLIKDKEREKLFFYFNG
ncbi:hypothetical protein AMECASPLE_021460 [Ameca splendens]|uniref:Uncharacterized protein n=1 Tax=Ameca splendens TaxID=208324 RepID=A0ABV0XGK5_9TELE